jgi:hypothetical protein
MSDEKREREAPRATARAASFSMATARLAAARSCPLRRFDLFAVDLFARQRTPLRANRDLTHRRKKAPLFDHLVGARKSLILINLRPTLS